MTDDIKREDTEKEVEVNQTYGQELVSDEEYALVRKALVASAVDQIRECQKMILDALNVIAQMLKYKEED